MIESFGDGCVCAEIGVLNGSFSKEILQFNPKELHLVDCWIRQHGSYEKDPTNKSDFDEMYSKVCSELGGDKRVIIHRQLSGTAALSFPDMYFDWVYIDADHTRPGITSDLHAWWPKIKTGGSLCGHDYCSNKWIKVKNVVDTWSRTVRRPINISRESFPSWMVVK